MLHRVAMVLVASLLASCAKDEQAASVSAVGGAGAATTIQSLLPADRLAQIKAALPTIGFGKINDVMNSPETLWYDHEVMTPSYQDSVGVNSNEDWPRLVTKGPTTNGAIANLFDDKTKRWQFPFAATAGTEKSSNTKVANFLHLPHQNGKPLSIPIWTQRKNADRPSWMWVYPIGTMVGEVIFLKSGGDLVAAEVRVRQRYKDGWATNIFRPFPTAKALSDAIKARKPTYASDAKLSRMVDHLTKTDDMKEVTVAGKGPLAKAFSHKAATDELPAFEDAALVKELLKNTRFVSTYGQAWKANGSTQAFAPTTTEDFSIVPKNYQAHAIAVTDDSCTRCHQNAGRRVSEFHDALYLYGEVWGKDSVFSFHPFDESEFGKIRQPGSAVDGYYDNRRINPKLEQMGVFERYDAKKHDTAQYPNRNQVLN